MSSSFASSSEPWLISNNNSSSGQDLNCTLSTSHKRVGCNQPFSVPPEPKRQQLSSTFFFDYELPTLEKDEQRMISANFLPDNTLPSFKETKLEDGLGNGEQNIADSSDYIDSLLDIIEPKDEIKVPSFSNLSHKSSNRSMQDELLPVLPIVRNDDLNVDDEEFADDTLLNNLPTSVDDFQAKEFNLKLERNYTSPLVSRRQSPINSFDASFGGSNASDCGHLSSRTHSVSSNPQLVGDLDAEDLEVAMINESFEEQQKQSKIYGCMNLKSLFYGTAGELRCDESQLDDIIYNSNEQKFSASNVVELSDDSEDNSTPPIIMSGNEFIPLLTPKSRQFVSRRKTAVSTVESGAMNIANKSKELVKLASSSSTVQSEELEIEDDEEKSRRLDMELEKMMLEEEEIFPQSYEGSPAPVQSLQPSVDGIEQPPILSEESRDANSDAAKLVAYGVIESLFSSPVNEDKLLMASPVNEDKLLMASPVKFQKQDSNSLEAVEEKMFLSESLLKDMATDDSSFLTDSLETSGHCSADIVDLLNVPEKSINTSSLYSTESSGHSSSATISSTADEQKVPIVDSWEDLEDDSDAALLMLNEVKNAFDVAKLEKKGASLVEVGKLAVASKEDTELNLLSHVLEAYCTTAKKNEEEMNEAMQMLGLGMETWFKKVDDRHYLIVFPTAAKASEALFSKRTNGLKLQLLADSSEQSRTKARQWKSTLKGKNVGSRPQTTATVARRMIESSLNVKIKVPLEQRQKEAKQLASAKEQKRLKNEIWGD